jgi:hypothetical protein
VRQAASSLDVVVTGGNGWCRQLLSSSTCSCSVLIFRKFSFSSCMSSTFGFVASWSTLFLLADNQDRTSSSTETKNTPKNTYNSSLGCVLSILKRKVVLDLLEKDKMQTLDSSAHHHFHPATRPFLWRQLCTSSWQNASFPLCVLIVCFVCLFFCVQSFSKFVPAFWQNVPSTTEVLHPFSTYTLELI